MNTGPARLLIACAAFSLVGCSPASETNDGAMDVFDDSSHFVNRIYALDDEAFLARRD